ncbi:MAG: TRAP transporter small permease subunit, partial [Enhydrobacter sp.]
MIARIETILRRAMELPTALLVLVEIFVLLAGVVSRFVFHHPFVWSDELASILFLWLAMLGSVVALQRMQHMRLTAVVSRLRPTLQPYAEVLSVAAPALFLAILLPYAWDYAAEEFYIETPALGLPNIVRAAAIPAGAAFMLLTCALRLVRFRLQPLLSVIAVLALIAGGLFFLAPVLKALGNWNLVFFFVVLLAAGVLLGVPIGFAFGTATVAFLMCVTRVPLTVVVSRMDEG